MRRKRNGSPLESFVGRNAAPNWQIEEAYWTN